MLDQDIVKAGITLGAVVLGFLLSQLSELIKSKIKTQSKQKTLKKLICLEITKNSQQLRVYWEELIDSKKEWKSDEGEFLYVQLASSIGSRPFPTLNKLAWEANIGNLASVYEESELTEIWDYYSNIEKLSELYRFFHEAEKQKDQTNRFHHSVNEPGMGSVVGSLISGFEFIGTVEDHSPEFKKLIENVINTKTCV